MTLTPGDDLNETSRQRTRDQFGLLQEAHGTAIIVDTDDPADFTFICSSEHVLARAVDPGADPDADDDAVNRLRSVVTTTVRRVRRSDRRPSARAGLSRRFTLPARRARCPTARTCSPPWPRSTQTRSSGLASPGPTTSCTSAARDRCCPATEPTETGLSGPWPPGPPPTRTPVDGVRRGRHRHRLRPHGERTDRRRARPGRGSRNVTGDPEPNGLRDPQSGHLREYAGHGTFVAGVIRAMAPKCTVEVLNLLVDRQQPGGGVFESQLVDELDDGPRRRNCRT